ncbi:MAG: 4a-hydroxytetrahydrobiopterin dehydratase [Bacteroidota bacterium]
MPTPLSDLEINAALDQLPGWTRDGDALLRRLEFSDFRAAVSFIVRMAFYAEQHNHHPDLRNVYNRIELRLTTHDAGNRITERDVQLAKAIERFVWV